MSNQIKNLPPVPEGVTNVEMSFGQVDGLGGENWRCWESDGWSKPKKRGLVVGRLYARWDEPEPKAEQEPETYVDVQIDEWSQQGPLGDVRTHDYWAIELLAVGLAHYVDGHEYRLEGFVKADGCERTTPTSCGVKAVAARFYLVKEGE